jgi:hypothetical protein
MPYQSMAMQLAQKLQETSEVALPPQPKIKYPILKHRLVEPPHFMTVPVMCVHPICCPSSFALLPPSIAETVAPWVRIRTVQGHTQALQEPAV